MIDPTTITELDVIDGTVEEMQAYVACEDCGDVEPAMDMVRIYGGSWLCWTCQNRAEAEFEEQQRYLARLPRL